MVAERSIYQNFIEREQRTNPFVDSFGSYVDFMVPEWEKFQLSDGYSMVAKVKGNGFVARKDVLLDWLEGDERKVITAQGFLAEIQSQQILNTILPAPFRAIQAPDSVDASDSESGQSGGDIIIVEPGEDMVNPMAILNIKMCSSDSITSNRGWRRSGFNPFFQVSSTLFPVGDLYDGFCASHYSAITRPAIQNGIYHPFVGLLDKDGFLAKAREILVTSLAYGSKSAMNRLSRAEEKDIPFFEQVVRKNSQLINLL